MLWLISVSQPSLLHDTNSSHVHYTWLKNLKSRVQCIETPKLRGLQENQHTKVFKSARSGLLCGSDTRKYLSPQHVWFFPSGSMNYSQRNQGKWWKTPRWRKCKIIPGSTPKCHGLGLISPLHKNLTSLVKGIFIVEAAEAEILKHLVQVWMKLEKRMDSIIPVMDLSGIFS